MLIVVVEHYYTAILVVVSHAQLPLFNRGRYISILVDFLEGTTCQKDEGEMGVDVLPPSNLFFLLDGFRILNDDKVLS